MGDEIPPSSPIAQRSKKTQSGSEARPDGEEQRDQLVLQAAIYVLLCISPVSIVGCCAACSETAFLFELLGCRPNLLRGAAPEPRKGFHPLTLLRFALFTPLKHPSPPMIIKACQGAWLPDRLLLIRLSRNQSTFSAASKLKSDGSKFIRRTNSSASFAPCMRSMPLSSHSTHSGPW